MCLISAIYLLQVQNNLLSLWLSRRVMAPMVRTVSCELVPLVTMSHLIWRGKVYSHTLLADRWCAVWRYMNIFSQQWACVWGNHSCIHVWMLVATMVVYSTCEVWRRANYALCLKSPNKNKRISRFLGVTIVADFSSLLNVLHLPCIDLHREDWGNYLHRWLADAGGSKIWTLLTPWCLVVSA